MATAKKAKTVIAALAGALTFPRAMAVVNDTAQDWVICGKWAPRSTTSEPFTVQDGDHLIRCQNDCKYILGISDHYKPVEGKPDALRMAEVGEVASDDTDDTNATPPVDPSATPPASTDTAPADPAATTTPPATA